MQPSCESPGHRAAAQREPEHRAPRRAGQLRRVPPPRVRPDRVTRLERGRDEGTEPAILKTRPLVSASTLRACPAILVVWVAGACSLVPPFPGPPFVRAPTAFRTGRPLRCWTDRRRGRADQVVGIIRGPGARPGHGRCARFEFRLGGGGRPRRADQSPGAHRCRSPTAHGVSFPRGRLVRRAGQRGPRRSIGRVGNRIRRVRCSPPDASRPAGSHDVYPGRELCLRSRLLGA